MNPQLNSVVEETDNITNMEESVGKRGSWVVALVSNEGRVRARLLHVATAAPRRFSRQQATTSTTITTVATVALARAVRPGRQAG